MNKSFRVVLSTVLILSSLSRHYLISAQAAASKVVADESTHVHTQPARNAPVHVLVLPEELEVRLATTALPPSLRDAAGIRVLKKDSYVEFRRAVNPFTCIVSRRGGNLYPVCFDEEGTRTILPAYEDDATLRMSGMTDDAVETEISRRFASGRYRPPARPGIAYMLSPATYMLGPDGKLARSVPPHIMFYAPFLTDADIGGSMGKTAFVDRPGPHGMTIVAAGQAERDRAMAAQKQLVDQIDELIEKEK